MSIIVEREFQESATPDRLWAADRLARLCFATHRVRAVLHYLATDGARTLCVLEAPDAEAVRTAARTIGFRPPDRVWPTSVYRADMAEADPSAPPALSRGNGTLALVERSFPEPVRFDDLQAVEDQASWCLRLHEVRFLLTYLSLDRRRMVCLYEAPDAEAVRLTNRRIGLPFDRIWTATLLPAG